MNMNGMYTSAKTVILIILLIFSGCREAQEEKEEIQEIAVKTFTVSLSTDQEIISSSGKLSLKEESILSFKSGGIIQSLFAEEGTVVRKGELLAQLKLSEIRANVEQAKLAYEKAQRDFERTRNLYRDSVASLEHYQNAGTALDFAKTNLTIAEFNLEHAYIKAPSNGYILRKLAHENELKGPGSPIYLFASTDKDWILKVNLSDRQLVSVQTGDSALLNFDAFPGRSFQAVLTEKAASADPYTGTYECELTVLQADPGFVSGLIGKALIFCSTQDGVIEIPYDAIVEGNDMQAEIFILKEGKVEERKITIKDFRQDKILVQEGLQTGDTVIIEGLSQIKTGDRVIVKQQP